MSYSRWSNSRWYTYWDANSPRQPWSKQDQVFTICDLSGFSTTYRDIRSDVDQVLKTVELHFSQEHTGSIWSGIDSETNQPYYEDTVWPANPPTEAQLEELKDYMLRFVDDVDEYFTVAEYSKYEVYYPIRNWFWSKWGDLCYWIVTKWSNLLQAQREIHAEQHKPL